MVFSSLVWESACMISIVPRPFRACYTLQAHAHAPGDPRKSDTIVYSPFIVHKIARHAKPMKDHYGNVTSRYMETQAHAQTRPFLLS